MDPKIEKRLKAMGAMAASGQLGGKAEAAARAWADVPTGGPALIKSVTDLYNDLRVQSSEELTNLVDLLVKLIIVVYREAKRVDPVIAAGIPNSLLKDFPGAPRSCLYSKWESLSSASIAFGAAPKTDRTVVFQLATTLVVAANEFLGGLVGFLLAGWRCASGKSVKPGLFKQSNGAKFKELSQLTGGEDGALYIFFGLASSRFRNAIAHGDVWLNSAENKVEYSDDDGEYEMSLNDFGAHIIGSSWLGRAYLAAIGAIAILEEGSVLELMQLPQHLVTLFHFNPDAAPENPMV